MLLYSSLIVLSKNSTMNIVIPFTKIFFKNKRKNSCFESCCYDIIIVGVNLSDLWVMTSFLPRREKNARGMQNAFSPYYREVV